MYTVMSLVMTKANVLVHVYYLFVICSRQGTADY